MVSLSGKPNRNPGSHRKPVKPNRIKTIAATGAILAMVTIGVATLNHNPASLPVANAAQQNAIPSEGQWLGQKTVNGTVFHDRDGSRASV